MCIYIYSILCIALGSERAAVKGTDLYTCEKYANANDFEHELSNSQQVATRFPACSLHDEDFHTDGMKMFAIQLLITSSTGLLSQGGRALSLSFAWMYACFSVHLSPPCQQSG